MAKPDRAVREVVKVERRPNYVIALCRGEAIQPVGRIGEVVGASWPLRCSSSSVAPLLSLLKPYILHVPAALVVSRRRRWSPRRFDLRLHVALSNQNIAHRCSATAVDCRPRQAGEHRCILVVLTSTKYNNVILPISAHHCLLA